MVPNAFEKAVNQYLDRYAEPEAAVAAGMNLGYYPFCLVIPARGENWSRIAAALDNVSQKFLLILIVNAPEPETKTLQLLADVRHQGQCREQASNVEYFETSFTFDLLLVDRCSAGRTIPPRQGVGLARKAGADIALALMARRTVDPGFIYCTDADVDLPAGYFQSVQWPAEVAALLFPFTHVASPELQEAASLYEIAMLYYAAGLKYAGSPYAFPALGSCLAVEMHHYARVRGFPRRNAAEDFYLLNKLAKSGRIQMLPTPAIRVAGRYSARVPFGTGVGIAKIMQLDVPARDYLFYHPRIFELLRQWITLLGKAWQVGGIPPAASDPVELAAWIATHNVDTIVSRMLGRCRSEAVFTKAAHDWFDGGLTLRFVHFMRDNFLPSIPLAALTGTGFLSLPRVGAKDLATLREHLLAQLFQHDAGTD